MAQSKSQPAPLMPHATATWLIDNTGLGFEQCDFNGRFIQADFDNVSVASFSVPSGLKGAEAQQAKDEYLHLLKGHFTKTLRKRREFNPVQPYIVVDLGNQRSPA